VSQSSQNMEFHRADPGYRRRMQIWLLASTLGASLLLVALWWWLDRLNTTLLVSNIDDYQRWMARLLSGLCLLLGVGTATFGLWLRRIAQETLMERRWPPSGLKTSSDVRIRYLTSADTFVQKLQASVWVLWFLASALILWGCWLLLAA